MRHFFSFVGFFLFLALAIFFTSCSDNDTRDKEFTYPRQVAADSLQGQQSALDTGDKLDDPAKPE